MLWRPGPEGNQYSASGFFTAEKDCLNGDPSRQFTKQGPSLTTRGLAVLSRIPSRRKEGIALET
jgi:hypothetical protein